MTMQSGGHRKVFGIGFQKTGTTTLKKALQILGYNVKGGGRDLIEPITEKVFSPVFDVVRAFDAFEDHPWPQVFREVDREFPGSRFILTIRNETQWIESLVNHLGFFPDSMQRFIYGVGFPAGYEEICLQKYRIHNKRVIKYFADRPDDLLVVDWKDGHGWKALCPFLGKRVPDIEFPHENAGSYPIWRKILWKAGGVIIRTAGKISARNR